MEYRAQTYLVALQLFVVIFGTLFLANAVDKVEMMLMPDPDDDPLKYIRPVAQFGWLLAVIPIAWVWLTIRAEVLGFRWMSKGLVAASGVLLLGVLATVFLLAAVSALQVLEQLSG